MTGGILGVQINTVVCSNWGNYSVFHCRPSMSGPHLLKKGREHRKMDVHRDFTVASPAEFVTRFGGNRVIDKVRRTAVFVLYNCLKLLLWYVCCYIIIIFSSVASDLFHVRCWLLIMASLLLNACGLFAAGPMRCFEMRGPFASWWWSRLKTWKPMQVNNKEWVQLWFTPKSIFAAILVINAYFMLCWVTFNLCLILHVLLICF